MFILFWGFKLYIFIWVSFYGVQVVFFVRRFLKMTIFSFDLLQVFLFCCGSTCFLWCTTSFLFCVYFWKQLFLDLTFPFVLPSIRIIISLFTFSFRYLLTYF